MARLDFDFNQAEIDECLSDEEEVKGQEERKEPAIVEEGKDSMGSFVSNSNSDNMFGDMSPPVIFKGFRPGKRELDLCVPSFTIQEISNKAKPMCERNQRKLPSKI